MLKTNVNLELHNQQNHYLYRGNSQNFYSMTKIKRVYQQETFMKRTATRFTSEKKKMNSRRNYSNTIKLKEKNFLN